MNTAVSIENHIPDVHRLFGAVMDVTTNPYSTAHGPGHWKQVAEVGTWLLTAETDPTVVFLFAMFHDSMRENDHDDPDHGLRGARLANELEGTYFSLSSEQKGLLEIACVRHTDGDTIFNPTIGTCWDADRLTLPRVGYTVNPELLSMDKSHDLIWDAEGLVFSEETKSWSELRETYARSR